MLMKFLLLWQPWGRWFRFRKDVLRCGTLFVGYRHSSLLVGIEGFQGQGQLMPVVSTFSFLCGEFLVTQLSAWHRWPSWTTSLCLLTTPSRSETFAWSKFSKKSRAVSVRRLGLGPLRASAAISRRCANRAYLFSRHKQALDRKSTV